MKGCLFALGVLAGLVLLVVGVFWFSFYHVHVRYRLTVEVQDGDHVKTGSSVIDVSYNIDAAWFPSGPNTQVRVIGYAPTVDLVEKGMLFLTFTDAKRTPKQIEARNKQVFCALDDIACLPFAAYDRPGTVVRSRSTERKPELDELLRQSGPRDVPFIALPKLVRILAINDPLTQLPVSPDGLAVGFGPGVELKRVILELTDDPVTPPPENWPQWLAVKRQNTEFRGYEDN